MSSKRIFFVILAFISVALILIVVLEGRFSFFTTGTTNLTAADPTSVESAQNGTENWQIPPTKESTYQIQAYAGSTSVAPGSSITFYVSTQDPGDYTIDIYRMGWYGGAGARLMTSIPNNVGENQGYYNIKANELVCSITKCPPPDRHTGLFEVDWDPGYRLTIPTNWISGVYLAKLTDADGWQTYAPFDVRGNFHSTYIAVTPDTTAEAYNLWGGASLYQEEAQTVPQYSGIPVSPGAGVQQVSFNKPYATGVGSGLVLVYELPTIRWLGRQGYDVSYISSTDLDQHPEQLLNHKAFLSIGHDEYWTLAMRRGVENARDHGVGLAFLGANTAYWQMRFEPGSNDRVITCYKVLASNDSPQDPNDYSRDPEYGKNNSIVTSQWRDPVVNNLENSLTGVMYEDITHSQAGFAWTVSPQADSPLLANTGLRPGQSYGCGLVGYEWDRVWNLPTDPANYRAATPENIQIIGKSVVISNPGSTDATQGPKEYSNTAYYIASSGALVFASGAVYWGNALDDYRDVNYTTQLSYLQALAKACGGNVANSRAVPEIQKLMANVMGALNVRHPSGKLEIKSSNANR